MSTNREEFISEAYLIQQWEKEAARKLKPIYYDLGAWRARSDKGIYMNDWRRDNHVIRLNDDRDGKKTNYVRFKNFRYTSGDVEYGNPVTISSEIQEDGGWIRELDKRGDSDDGMLTIHEGVTLHRNVEMNINAEVRFDVTSRTKVSGSYGGAEVEQELEIAFGTTISTGEVKTEGKDIEQSMDLEQPVKAGQGKIAVLERNRVVTDTPFTINGTLDCAMQIDFEDWAGDNRKDITGRLLWSGRKSRNEMWFDSIADFLRFMYGYNVDYPQMDKFLPNCSSSSRKVLQWFADSSTRVVKVKGTKRREFDNHAKLRVRDL